MTSGKMGRLFAFALVLAAACAMLLPLSGCGGDEEEVVPPPEEQAAGPAEQPAVPAEPVIEAPETVAFEDYTPVQQALSLLPPDGALAMVFTSPESLYAKVVGLAKRLAPPEVDIEAKLQEMTREMASAAGVTDAGSIPDVLRAKGLDPNAPVALFMRFDDEPERYKALLSAMAAPTAPGDVFSGLEEEGEEGEISEAPLDAPEPADAATPPDAAEGESLSEGETAVESEAPAEDEAAVEGEAPAEDDAAVEGEAPAEGDVLAEENLAEGAPEVDVKIEELPFDLAFVAHVTDPAAAEASIEQMASAEDSPVDPANKTVVEADGVSIVSYDPEKLNYALLDGRIVISQSLDMVKSVVAQVANPRQVVYGTRAFPGDEADEIVLVQRADQMFETLDTFIKAAEEASPEMAGVLKMQTQSLQTAAEAYGDEPVLARMSWDDEKITFYSHMDVEAHPKLLELSGTPAPMQQALLLPDSTAMLMSFQFTPEAKAQMVQQMTAAAQTDPAAAQQMAMINSILTSLGNEVTIAVTGAENGYPKAVIMLGLVNPEQFKSMLMMFGVPMQPAENYNGVDILQMPIPLEQPIAINFAFTPQMAIVANDMGQLKSVLDRSAETPTAGPEVSKPFIATLSPPMDPQLPRYSVLYLSDALITDVVMPVLETHGAASPELKATLERVAATINQVRASQELKDGLAINESTVYLDAQ